MGDPKRIGVTGPLVAYRDGFVEELAGQGYTAGSAMHQVWLMAHVSGWLEGRALGAGDLTLEQVEEFLEVRRAAGYTAVLSKRGLAPLLGYLRGVGVTPTPPERAALTPAEVLLEEYSTFLERERGAGGEAGPMKPPMDARRNAGSVTLPGSMDRRRAKALVVQSAKVEFGRPAQTSVAQRGLMATGARLGCCQRTNGTSTSSGELRSSATRYGSNWSSMCALQPCPIGQFCADAHETSPFRPVFSRLVSLFFGSPSSCTAPASTCSFGEL